MIYKIVMIKSDALNGGGGPSQQLLRRTATREVLAGL